MNRQDMLKSYLEEAHRMALELATDYEDKGYIQYASKCRSVAESIGSVLEEIYFGKLSTEPSEKEK